MTLAIKFAGWMFCPSLMILGLIMDAIFGPADLDEADEFDCEEMD